MCQREIFAEPCFFRALAEPLRAKPAGGLPSRISSGSSDLSDELLPYGVPCDSGFIREALRPRNLHSTNAGNLEPNQMPRKSELLYTLHMDANRNAYEEPKVQMQTAHTCTCMEPASQGKRPAHESKLSNMYAWRHRWPGSDAKAVDNFTKPEG